MDNSLNNTQTGPDTANPQRASQANGANQAEEFQPAAEANALDDQTQELSVQKTGDPLDGVAKSSSSTNYVAWGLIAAVALVAIVWFAKLLIEDTEPDAAPARSSVPKPVAKKAAPKKTATKKKPVSKSRSKKTAKKRR